MELDLQQGPRKPNGNADDTLIAKITKNAREVVFVTTGAYNGHDYVGIRVWIPGKEGDLIPTQKGINLAPGKVPALIEALQAAIAG